MPGVRGSDGEAYGVQSAIVLRYVAASRTRKDMAKSLNNWRMWSPAVSEWSATPAGDRGFDHARQAGQLGSGCLLLTYPAARVASRSCARS
jgi:hypothetical protein